ncbi:MAG: hypothetical protein JO247_07255 [Chloroflexi bacterium]|nr:hypothetical protein [Chloroflexota bacterium]
MKKPGPVPGTANARHGGDAVKAKYGSEYFATIGRKGGEAVRQDRGAGFFATIGTKGGVATKRTHGQEFYADIGRKGGLRHGSKPAERETQPE